MLLQDVEPPRSRTPSRRVLPSAQLFQLCSVWAPSFIDPMLFTFLFEIYCVISSYPMSISGYLQSFMWSHVISNDLALYYLMSTHVTLFISCFFMWLHCFTSQVRDDFGTFHLRRQAAFSLQNWNEGWNDENIFLCRMPSWTGLHC